MNQLSMTNLAQRWCDAPVQNIEEAEQEELFNDSVQEADAFNAESLEQNDLVDDKIAHVCLNVIKKFEKLSIGELEQLTLWVGHHSNGVSDGAFKSLHTFLASVMEKIKKCPSILNFLPNNVSDSNSDCLEYIDLAVFHYMNKNYADVRTEKYKNKDNQIQIKGNTNSFFSLPNEIQLIIFSEMGLKDLLAVHKTVRNPGKAIVSALTKKLEKAKLEELLSLRACPGDNLNKGIVVDELIKRLNDEKFFLKDLNIIDSQIVDFFGKKCADVLVLDFSDFGVTGLSFLKYFPNLKKIKLPNEVLVYNFMRSTFSPHREMTSADTSNLRYCPDLESIEIRYCNNIKNLNFLENCKKIRNLKIYCCGDLDDANFDALQDNEHLQYLSINNINITNLNFLKKFPNLQAVAIKNTKIKDISGFEFCKNLRKIKLTDLAMIKDIASLSNCKYLHTLFINGCTKISSFSVLKKCKQLKNLIFNCLPQLNSSTDFSFINSLDQLEITACQGLTDTNFLKYCQKSLSDLKLISCPRIKEINFTGNMPNLKSFTVSGFSEFEGFKFSQPLLQLEKVDLSYFEIDDEQLQSMVEFSPNIKTLVLHNCPRISHDLRDRIHDQGIKLVVGKLSFSESVDLR